MKREINNELSESLPVLHKILLMVENDMVSYSRGCNWSDVKRDAGHVKIKNVDNQVIIESSNGKSVLKMRKGKSIASRFLKNFRDAFAHNYIVYNKETETLAVELKSSESGKKRKIVKLTGEISVSALKKIVELIKKSKKKQ